MDTYRSLLTDTYSAYFAEWEKQALIPKDLYQRTPNEVVDRQRIAHVIKCLRMEREVPYNEVAVLAELQRLVLAQTKAANCYEAFSLAEIAALEEKIQTIGTGGDAWSKLLRLLRHTRSTSMQRYQEARSQAA